MDDVGNHPYVPTNDETQALRDLAAWWAVEMAGNEVRVEGFDIPAVFLDLVAEQLVSNPFLGWPDIESARTFLAELY